MSLQGKQIETMYSLRELEAVSSVNKNILYRMIKDGYLVPEDLYGAKYYTKEGWEKAKQLLQNAQREKQETIENSKLPQKKPKYKLQKGNSARERGKERNAMLRQAEKEMRAQQDKERAAMGFL